MHFKMTPMTSVFSEKAATLCLFHHTAPGIFRGRETQKLPVDIVDNDFIHFGAACSSQFANITDIPFLYIVMTFVTMKCNSRPTSAYIF